MMLVQRSSPIPEPPPLQLSHNSPHIITYEEHARKRLKHSRIADAVNSRASRLYSLREATIRDAEPISELGATTFSNTFGFSMPARDLQSYLSEAYNLQTIQNEIRNPSIHFVVACSSANGNIIGFAQLTEGTSEPCLDGIESIVELQRLYVNTECHRLGVGSALLEWLEEVAQRLQYRSIWLGVWEGNFIAQKFYEDRGYDRYGDHEFQMGRCIQTDWIMYKSF